MIARELGTTWTHVWLTVVVATAVYAGMIVLSRIFGQRQFSSSSSYDLAFVFALGSLLGRVILVRTSLLTALVGLATMFGLHAATGWLHHRVSWIHDAIQNRPVLVLARGEVLDDMLRRAHASRVELYQQLRLQGHASAAGVQAAILERNGAMSVIAQDEPLDPELLAGVEGAERLAT